MEAHFAREDLGGERSGVSLQRLQPNARQPFGHKHTKDEELYVVVAGGGRVKLDDDVHDLRTWDAVRVAPGVMRNFEAGPEGIAFLAFGSPASGTADTEVIQAWWTWRGGNEVPPTNPLLHRTNQPSAVGLPPGKAGLRPRTAASSPRLRRRRGLLRFRLELVADAVAGLEERVPRGALVDLLA